MFDDIRDRCRCVAACAVRHPVRTGRIQFSLAMLLAGVFGIGLVLSATIRYGPYPALAAVAGLVVVALVWAARSKGLAVVWSAIAGTMAAQPVILGLIVATRELPYLQIRKMLDPLFEIFGPSSVLAGGPMGILLTVPLGFDLLHPTWTCMAGLVVATMLQWGLLWRWGRHLLGRGTNRDPFMLLVFATAIIFALSFAFHLALLAAMHS